MECSTGSTSHLESEALEKHFVARTAQAWGCMTRPKYRTRTDVAQIRMSRQPSGASRVPRIYFIQHIGVGVRQVISEVKRLRVTFEVNTGLGRY